MKSYNLVLIILIAIIKLTINEATNFDYGKHGEDWTGDCANKALNKQSPIILPINNLTSKKSSYLFGDLRMTASAATIYNTTILIKPKESDGSFGQVYTQLIDKSPIAFKAVQIRIRTRSQHRIGDEKGFYDLELQITLSQLFDSQNNKKLMIGLLFKAEQTEKDPFLDEIIQNAPAQFNKTFQISANLDHLLSREKIFNFWYYVGSITIPTCKNGAMNWIIPDKIFKMGTTQLAYFQTKYPDGNWRDVQRDEGNQIGYATVLPQSSQF